MSYTSLQEYQVYNPHSQKQS